jgi:hypothetical protein
VTTVGAVALSGRSGGDAGRGSLNRHCRIWWDERSWVVGRSDFRMGKEES